MKHKKYIKYVTNDRICFNLMETNIYIIKSLSLSSLFNLNLNHTPFLLPSLPLSLLLVIPRFSLASEATAEQVAM